ncbi:hypothetical protein T484DRAFT_1842205 [Baffinella frigidus]|nr:hypothetical protein T484DRAFT_1842205 [Cryptophyta sp. CCMP2293]
MADGAVLLIMRIDLGGGKFGKIHVRRGNRSEDLADKFVRDHGLPSEVLPHLVEQIRQSVSALAPPAPDSSDDSSSDDDTSSSSDDGDSRGAQQAQTEHGAVQSGGRPTETHEPSRRRSNGAGPDPNSRPAPGSPHRGPSPTALDARFSGLSPPGRSNSFTAAASPGGRGEAPAPLALVFGTPKSPW